MSARPSVVLTNDDGIGAPGIAALDDALGDVSVTRISARTNTVAHEHFDGLEGSY